MSFVNATPEYVAAAASDLANIGATINSANSAALGPTSSVPAAGADAVSAGIAVLFDAHAQAYQALSAQAALFHRQFVQLMSGGAAQYAIAEAANAAPLQTAEHTVLSEANASSQVLTTGEPLIGTAAQTGSVATGVPAATAGLAGGAAPAVPAGHLATAVSAAPAAATVAAPASTPVTAAPAGSAALASAPASAPLAAMQAATPAYSPATAAAAAAEVPEAASTPVAPVEAGTPGFSPAAAMPAAVRAGADTPAVAPAYSPATAGPAGSAKGQPAAIAD